MIPKPLSEEITPADLQALVAGKVAEVRTLDYKQDIKISTDAEKREMARDVSSFANAAGGDLVFGVVEARDGDNKKLGYPEKIVGVPVNFEETKVSLENIIRDTIDPRVQGIVIRKVDGFELGPVVVLRIPRSWNAPHMVSFSNKTHFYSRNNSGKQPLDVREIRASFLSGTEMELRVRQFRDARLGAIVAGDTPVPLPPGPKLVLHAIPLLTNRQDVFDLKQLVDGADHLVPFGPQGRRNWRFNLDGVVAYFAYAQDAPRKSYSQAFRHGALEGVAIVEMTQCSDTAKALVPFQIEDYVHKGLVHYSRQLRRVNPEVPISVHAALTGGKGLLVNNDNVNILPQNEDDYRIDRDILLLPDVLLESMATDIPAVLRPLFDAFWQAGGHERSLGYDKAGKWSERAHQSW
jgi:hypothetical protein